MSDRTSGTKGACQGRSDRRGRAAVMLVMLIAIAPRVRADAGEEVSLGNMLRLADAVRHPINEGVIRIRATVEKPGEGPLVSDLEVFVQGQDRVLTVFRSGPLEGRRILTVGKKVWLLIPDVARPIPISANQRLLGGVSISDLARLSFASDYDARLLKENDLIGSDSCRVLELSARTRQASYASGILWIGRKDGLPRQAELALLSGKPAKLVHFDAYDYESDRPILKRMRIVHLLPTEHGMKTILEFTGYERRTLAADLFDPDRARDAS